jgi:hypothetical protein
VAIALAVSWKPLVKSKASAVATTITTRSEGSTPAPSVRRSLSCERYLTEG